MVRIQCRHHPSLRLLQSGVHVAYPALGLPKGSNQDQDQQEEQEQGEKDRLMDHQYQKGRTVINCLRSNRKRHLLAATARNRHLEEEDLEQGI